MAAEIQGKLERWLWLPGNTARPEPPCIGVREPDGRPSGVWQRERAVNHARLDTHRPQEGKIAPRGLQKLVFEFLHRSIPHIKCARQRHALRGGPACPRGGGSAQNPSWLPTAVPIADAPPAGPDTVLLGSGLPVFGAERSRSVDNWLRQQVAAAHIGHRRLAALQIDGLDGLRGHLAAVGGLGAGDDFLAVGGN